LGDSAVSKTKHKNRVEMTNPIILEKTGSPKIFLWGDYREKEDFSKYSKYSRARELEPQETYTNLIDCIYKIASSKQIESEYIALFRKAFLSKTQFVWEKAGEKIVQFSHYFTEFAILLDELAYSKSAAIRLRVIQSFWSDFPPQEQSFQILTSALKDTSRKNREFTIDRIMYFNLEEFLTALKKSLETETDTNIKKRLANTVCLFEKGYYVKELNDKKVSITFRSKNGGLTVFLIEKEGLTEELIRAKIEKRK
jgi:hypothetical protein